MVRRYLLHFIEAYEYSGGYIKQCIAALKFFFRDVSPEKVSGDAFPRIRARRTLPTVLTREEVAALLVQVVRPKYRAILMLTYGAGLRVGEVVSLKPEDLDPERGLLHVREGKGGWERYVLLSRVAYEAVRRYRLLKPSEEWLFPGARPGHHLSTRSVQRAFARARDAARIRKSATVHTLRHSFATHLLEQGTDLLYIQKLLGHVRPASTLIYIHLTQEDLTDIQSPLDGLELDRSG